MRDQVFSGADVPAALAVAASTLGLPETALRYVVLEPGTPASRGLQPTPARVAVLLEENHEEGAADEPAAAGLHEDPRAGIRELIRQIAETARIDVWAEIGEDEEDVRVRLEGPGHSFFFGREGRGDVLRATEHVLQRMFGSAFLPRHLRLECHGFQERLAEALAEEAQALATAVRGDGAPRTTEPLNGYERRVVHLALSDEEGIRTYSVGEGAARRVTVALAAADAEDETHPRAGNPEGSDD